MIHVLIFRNVPCDVEPEIFGDTKCRKPSWVIACATLCAPPASPSTPDSCRTPPMYARETPLEAYMAYLSTLANMP